MTNRSSPSFPPASASLRPLPHLLLLLLLTLCSSATPGVTRGRLWRGPGPPEAEMVVGRQRSIRHASGSEPDRIRSGPKEIGSKQDQVGSKLSLDPAVHSAGSELHRRLPGGSELNLRDSGKLHLNLKHSDSLLQSHEADGALVNSGGRKSNNGETNNSDTKNGETKDSETNGSGQGQGQGRDIRSWVWETSGSGVTAARVPAVRPATGRPAVRPVMGERQIAGQGWQVKRDLHSNGHWGPVMGEDTLDGHTSDAASPVRADALGHHEPPLGYNDPLLGHHSPPSGHYESTLGFDSPFLGHHEPPLGYNDPLLRHHDPYAGHHDPPLGQHDPSLGHHDPSLGHHDPSLGHHDPSLGHHDPSLGFHDSPLGHNDPPAGSWQPINAGFGSISPVATPPWEDQWHQGGTSTFTHTFSGPRDDQPGPDPVHAPAWGPAGDPLYLPDPSHAQAVDSPHQEAHLLPDDTRGNACRCWDTEAFVPEIQCRCWNVPLTHVPTNFTNSVSRITLTNVDITTLRNDSFTRYRNTLKDIVLEKVEKLQTIEAGAFKGLSHLRSIYIHMAPQLRSMPNLTVNEDNTNLTSIRISSSGLQIIPTMKMAGSSDIFHMIELDNNRIKKVHTGAFVVRVDELSLNYNKIEKVEKEAFAGSAIGKLSLKGNMRLKELHPEAFKGIERVRTLDLSETSITSLPTLGLTDLEELYLEKTMSLKVFPSVYSFKYIEKAYLTYHYHCCAFQFPEQHDPKKYQEFMRKMEEHQQCSDFTSPSTIQIGPTTRPRRRRHASSLTRTDTHNSPTRPQDPGSPRSSPENPRNPQEERWGTLEATRDGVSLSLPGGMDDPVDSGVDLGHGVAGVNEGSVRGGRKVERSDFSGWSAERHHRRTDRSEVSRESVDRGRKRAERSDGIRDSEERGHSSAEKLHVKGRSVENLSHSRTRHLSHHNRHLRTVEEESETDHDKKMGLRFTDGDRRLTEKENGFMDGDSRFVHGESQLMDEKDRHMNRGGDVAVGQSRFANVESRNRRESWGGRDPVAKRLVSGHDKSAFTMFPGGQEKETVALIREPDGMIRESDELLRTSSGHKRKPNDPMTETNDRIRKPNDRLTGPKDRIREPSDRIRESMDHIKKLKNHMENREWKPQGLIRESEELIPKPYKRIPEAKEEAFRHHVKPLGFGAFNHSSVRIFPKSNDRNISAPDWGDDQVWSGYSPPIDHGDPSSYPGRFPPPPPHPHDPTAGFHNIAVEGGDELEDDDQEIQPPEEHSQWHPKAPTSINKTLVVMCGPLSKDYHNVYCTPSPDAFNPCEDIMGNLALRVAVWLVVVTAVVGNLAVMIVLISSKFKMSVSKFLMVNLALADLCMGVYLLLIAAMDLHTIGVYFNYAIDWQHGPGCKVAGFLTVFASELSIFTLTVITSERWYAITYAIHLNKRLKLSMAMKIMVVGWAYSITMAALPLLGVSSYSKTSICLPMEVGDALALAYLIALLLVNGLAFFVITACYASMYCSISRHDATAPHSDLTVAKRMALLVFTDFACWAPIAFFGLTAVAGLPLINVTRAKILLVFFYPLNSCANPYLYAILTKQYRRDLFILLARYGFCTKRAMKYKGAYSSVNNTLPHNTVVNAASHRNSTMTQITLCDLTRGARTSTQSNNGSLLTTVAVGGSQDSLQRNVSPLRTPTKPETVQTENERLSTVQEMSHSTHSDDDDHADDPLAHPDDLEGDGGVVGGDGGSGGSCGGGGGSLKLQGGSPHPIKNCYTRLSFTPEQEAILKNALQETKAKAKGKKKGKTEGYEGGDRRRSDQEELLGEQELLEEMERRTSLLGDQSMSPIDQDVENVEFLGSPERRNRDSLRGETRQLGDQSTEGVRLLGEEAREEISLLGDEAAENINLLGNHARENIRVLEQNRESWIWLDDENAGNTGDLLGDQEQTDRALLGDGEGHRMEIQRGGGGGEEEQELLGYQNGEGRDSLPGVEDTIELLGREKKQKKQQQGFERQKRERKSQEKDKKNQGREKKGQERDRKGQERERKTQENERKDESRERKNQERERRDEERERKDYDRERREQERDRKYQETEARAQDRDRKLQDRDGRETEREISDPLRGTEGAVGYLEGEKESGIIDFPGAKGWDTRPLEEGQGGERSPLTPGGHGEAIVICEMEVERQGEREGSRKGRSRSPNGVGLARSPEGREGMMTVV